MSKQRGFSLIELMVAILIGLIVTLAAMTIVADSEGRRRTQSSVTGIDQSSQFTAYTLDELIRSAGSGFAQSWNFTFGCKLFGTIGTTPIFPISTPPAPFTSVPTLLASNPLRLAPLIILKGSADTATNSYPGDIIVTAAGSAGFGEIALPFGSVPAGTTLNLTGTTTVQTNDLLLIADQNIASGPADCYLEQAGTPSPPTAVPLTTTGTSTYYQALPSLSADGMAIPLGNPTNNNTPAITLLGVGSGGNDATATTALGSALYSYNLLTPSVNPQAISDGVIELRALYGVDTTGTGVVDSWVDPSTGIYAPSTLMNGTAASAQTLQRIKAVHIGMIVRTSLIEKDPISQSTISMFADIKANATTAAGTLTAQRVLSGDDLRYRYRVLETTIPLRNLLLLAN